MAAEPEGRLEPVHDAASSVAEHDLHASKLYLNRELTWLAFNRRVLHEAEDERTPLLERVKFLAIVGANLDEFVMKRIGGLKLQAAAGLRDLTIDGRTPAEQIAACNAIIQETHTVERPLLAHLTQRLTAVGIELLRYDDLGPTERHWLREHYIRNVFPLVTPQAVDPAHPFPFVSNLSLNLLISVRRAHDDVPSLARIKVPVGSGIPRLVRIGDACRFVPLEQVMAHNLDLLFPGGRADSCELFRVTRNANTERDEESADDLLALIETELRDRKFAPVVRLEVARGMSTLHRGMLAAELGLDEAADVVEVDGMLGTRDLMELAILPVSDLHDPAHQPIDNPRLTPGRNVFHVIRDAGAILLQHPYESFTSSVERFLREASEDPKVRAIKMTLYRTSERTGVIARLINAAQNGKQVAVVVELKARFDESANIEWASRLEEAGIHVTYGVMGLKTHCKIILVVRQDYDGLRRYAHVGTGNYHAETARIYCDLGLLTADEDIGHDLTELFNYLTTGHEPRRRYRKILVAPVGLKDALLTKIAREIEHHRAGRVGHVQMKINALEDVDVTRALYEASREGVAVDLLVRDTCRLRPGLPVLSESARVVSIVGRFLEHARIFWFRNGGDDEYFIGSADCMQRNLESRVEVVAPVEDPRARAELRFLLDAQFDDRRCGWAMQSDGSYVQRFPFDRAEARCSQERLIEHAGERHRAAVRGRRRRLGEGGDRSR